MPLGFGLLSAQPRPGETDEIGTGVILAPMHHPLRLAKELEGPWWPTAVDVRRR